MAAKPMKNIVCKENIINLRDNSYLILGFPQARTEIVNFYKDAGFILPLVPC